MGLFCRQYGNLVFTFNVAILSLEAFRRQFSNNASVFFPVISSTPQVSVTEYNKLQAEIRQLRSDLQVSKM